MVYIQNLTKSFGNFKALKGINLKLEKGQFLTIFGPNGAGKTTLIKILSTLMKPTSGVIKIAGLDPREDGESVRKQIGVISHSTYLYPNLTAYENLKFYGKMYDLQNLPTTIERVLEDVGLKDRMHDLVRTYSRGMQQRLSIARAILHDPAVMFLDEPYTGLDLHAAEMLRDLLQTVHTRERTVIMTTHSISQGLEVSDMVGILVRGKLVYLEPIQKIDTQDFGKTYFYWVEQAR
ncbi:MAG TPA: heme ABC exporter ATP-binding protein CcmA [Candidatus Limnocylindrales bacterium]|nr:heme ABC exporter ATP-binding protein CcmA [Candidatus Limnocylindrales bacterium]